MKRIFVFVIFLISINLRVMPLMFGTSHNSDLTVRYAFCVGANNGGPDRVLLRYADSDAESILNVLSDLGGVYSENKILLLDPDKRSFFSEFKKLKQKIENSRSESIRKEVIFYYSGHSDDKHILLGKEKILYKDIKEAIDTLDYDVCIIILDSCSSGSFTRMKGGKKNPPFLMDSAYKMEGNAVLTSSSSDEASQESDLIRGSFFTHFLISGLRGAADATGDGRVTLNEAYQFAFNETLIQTEKTSIGPQHPNYIIQMSGTGDVIMTAIHENTSALIFSEDVSGKIYIHDDNENIVVELTKPSGRSIKIGLKEGKYRIINIRNSYVYEVKINLIPAQNLELKKEKLVNTYLALNESKGNLYTQFMENGHINTVRHFLTFGLNGGMYFSQDENFKKVYGKNTGCSGIGIDYYMLFKNKNGIGISLHLTNISAAGETTYSRSKINLNMIPVSIKLFYMRDFGRILPFMGVGGEYYYFKENYAESFSVSSFSSSAVGYNFQFGTFFKVSSSILTKAYFIYHNTSKKVESLRVNLGGSEIGFKISYTFKF